MTVVELAKLVAEMRAAQALYFETKSSTILDHSKWLERRTDAAVREILEEPGLFPREEQ